MKKRARKKEWLDDPQHLSQKSYLACMKQLERVGRLLGGDTLTLQALRKYPQPESILDVGCGGGDLCARFAASFPKSQIVGLDRDARAIAYAKEIQPKYANLQFINGSLDELSAKSFDLITCTLVLHHIEEEELPAFFEEIKRVGKRAFFANDLRRSFLSWVFFCCAAPLLFRNHVIWHDGLLSIRRAYLQEELKAQLQASFSKANVQKAPWGRLLAKVEL